MSLEQEQSQQRSILSGLSMFTGQGVPKTDSTNVQKSDEPVPHAHETDRASSSSPSTKSPPDPSQPSPSSSSTIKLVGSNRLFMPIKK